MSQVITLVCVTYILFFIWLLVSSEMGNKDVDAVIEFFGFVFVVEYTAATEKLHFDYYRKEI